MKQNSDRGLDFSQLLSDRWKLPTVAFLGGIAITTVGSAIFSRKDSPTEVVSPTATGQAAPTVISDDDGRLSAFNLTSPSSERQPASPKNEAEQPVSVEIPFEELSCEDPKFTAELNRRRELLMAALDIAASKCGISPDQLIPPQLQDSLIATPADRLRLATNAERPELVNEILFDMRGQLTWELRSKLDVAGIAPYLGEVQMPSNYRKDQPNQLGTFSRLDAEGKTELFLFDTINGQLCVRKIPSDWGEGQIIMSLAQAEKAINQVELE